MNNFLFQILSNFWGALHFIGTVLPKISELKAKEIFSGGRFAQQFHFHKIGVEKYEKLRTILKAYSFNDTLIDQFLDGENIFQFTGNLEGHLVESRVVCECLPEGIIYVLFFDTNHHLYFDKSKAGESLTYDCCPFKADNECYNAYNCFAKEFLDFDKINASYQYSYSPS